MLRTVEIRSNVYVLPETAGRNCPTLRKTREGSATRKFKSASKGCANPPQQIMSES
jgi:hypothetical protein